MTGHSSDKWYCFTSEKEYGPMSLDSLQELVRQGLLKPMDKVKEGETGDWKTAKGIHHLKSIFASQMSTSAAASEALEKLHSHEAPVVGSSGSKPRKSKSAEQNFLFLLDVSASFLGFVLEKLSFLKILFKPISLVLVGVFLVLGSGIYWYGIDWYRRQNALSTYEQIWDEFKELRDQEPSEEQWRQFSENANSRLKPIVVSLQKDGPAADQLSIELLRAGRDYLPDAIRAARNGEDENEERVQVSLKRSRGLKQASAWNFNITSGGMLLVVMVCVDVALASWGLVWVKNKFFS